MADRAVSRSPETRRKKFTVKRQQPKTFVDESDGSERPTRIGKKYAVDSTTGEVSYKKTKTNQLSTSIQLGIRTMISSVTSKKRRDLLHTDFAEQESRRFPKAGSSTTVPHNGSDFKFYAYAPFAFRLFREQFGISTAEFMLSICDKPLIPLSNPGASGSVFYLSYDDTFIIKTVQKNEHNFMLRLLPGYYMNLVQNKKTTLPKFFGLFCYQNSAGKNIRFVVMNNLVPSRLSYYMKFDLKGSTHGREASAKEQRKTSPTYKDLDFMKYHPKGLRLAQATYDKLKKTMERDVLVLESFQIMDYSMFVGIHRIGVDTVKAERIDTDSDYTDGEDDGPSQPVFTPRAIAANLKISGCTGELGYVNGVYEIVDGLRHGRTAFKRSMPVPPGQGAMSGSPLFLHFNSDEKMWRISSAFDRENMTILMNSNTGDYNSPLDVPQGCWQILASEGAHVTDGRVQVGVAGPDDIATSKQHRLSADGPVDDKSKRRRSMSFGTITEQIGDESVPQALNHSIDDDSTDIYEGGLRLKLMGENGQEYDAVAYLGIIDILQNFRLSKKLEHKFKKFMYEGDACSVHKPKFYRKRFQNFLCGDNTTETRPPDGGVHYGQGVFRPEELAMGDSASPGDRLRLSEATIASKDFSGIANPKFSKGSSRKISTRKDPTVSEGPGYTSDTEGGEEAGNFPKAAAPEALALRDGELTLGRPSTIFVRSDADQELPTCNDVATPQAAVPPSSANAGILSPTLSDLNVSGASTWSEPPLNSANTSFTDTSSPVKPVESMASSLPQPVQAPIFNEAAQSPSTAVAEAARLKAEIAKARAVRKSMKLPARVNGASTGPRKLPSVPGTTQLSPSRIPLPAVGAASAPAATVVDLQADLTEATSTSPSPGPTSNTGPIDNTALDEFKLLEEEMARNATPDVSAATGPPAPAAAATTPSPPTPSPLNASQLELSMLHPTSPVKQTFL